MVPTYLGTLLAIPRSAGDTVTQLTLQLVANEFLLKAWESRWSSG